MGYSIWCSLDLLDINQEQIEKITSEIVEDYEYGLELFDQEEIRNWYTIDEDLIRMSTTYPEVVFDIEVRGEEATDMWRARFKNGEKEVIEYIWPPYKSILTNAEIQKQNKGEVSE